MEEFFSSSKIRFGNSMLSWNPFKKVQNITQKVTGQNLLHKVIKVKNSIFLSFIVDNFFHINFLATFSLDSKSASNSAFFNTHIAILGKIFNHFSTL
jgi:hypothetical protein